jgi:uncharacterized protein YecT (DUF1311 family)
MRVSLVILPLFVALAGPAVAQEAPDCAGAGGNTEILACMLTAYEQADAELDTVWKKVLASVEPKEFMSADEVRIWKEDLLESQRGWVIFKENDCDAVSYEWYGGTGVTIAVVSCLYDHTVARVSDLKQRYLDD